MKISVIIPTYNGAHKITRTLDCLRQQTHRSFEIIVVIDGSTDNTSEVLKKYNGAFDSFRIIQQNNAGRSRVRNRGAVEAAGDLLIFYDDDMAPDSQSVEKHGCFHLNFTGLLTGNQVELGSPQKTDIQNYKAILTEEWTKKYHNGLNGLSKENFFFTAANCSMKKEEFLLLKGFDERLTDAEDYDLARRAMELEIPVYFDKTNLAIHNDLITCRSYIFRIRQYKFAHESLCVLHPEWQAKKMLNDSDNRLAYWIFSFGLLPVLIDHFNIFLILPKLIRFKIYGAIIHSMGVVYDQTKLW